MSTAKPIVVGMEDIFAAHGPLAGALPGYAPRTAQVSMAGAVAQAIETVNTLVVEAGTGVGKTLAYLIPALLSGRRIVISTGTRNLQDQLFHRDLPTVTAALGQPVKIALLKGRANYLCRYRLQTNAIAGRRSLAVALREVTAWSHSTKAGDISEVTSVAEGHPIWPHVTSNADNCLGQDCPEFGDCHVVKARRKAQSAQIVVVNHHLLLADFSLKEEGFGELLPGADACIIDEAHQVPETAARFFGASVSGRQLQLLLADAQSEGDKAQIDAEPLRVRLQSLRDATAVFRESLGRHERRTHYAQLPDECRRRLNDLGECLDDLVALLAELDGHSAGLDASARRAQLLAAGIRRIADGENAEDIRWVEVFRNGFSLHSTPLEAADQLHAIMSRLECAWVLTSATLTVGDSFDHFTQRMGLEKPQTLALGSPFDFANNALLCLPRGLPAPHEPAFTAAVVATARPLIDAAGGGAFLLFTSRRALNSAAEMLRDDLDYPLLVQGDSPRDELLRQFREHGNAVLLGTASFWEGVDVRGAALSLVVIDKLPFASPGDPVTEARLNAMRQRGVNPFTHYQLPQAVLSLKQGVGRLIRDPGDSGVCVICDPRLVSKSYGRVFRASLPPMRETDSLREAGDFLRARRIS